MVATQIVGVTSQQRLTPYISVDMFKNHRRRGVQVDNLVPRGTADEQDAALAEVIEAASAWIDNLLPATLAATQDLVLDRLNVDRKGYLNIHPRYRPVIALMSVAVGASPNTLQAFADLTGCAVQPNKITVPTSPWAMTSSQGPLQFGYSAAPADQIWVQYGYQNGFPVTSMTAPAAQGAVSLAVADTTGIVAGQTVLTIYDLQRRARFTPSAVSTAPAGGVGTGPGTLTCNPLPWAVPNVGNYPTFVSALPADAIQAVVLAIRAMIKETGGGNPTASSRSATQKAPEPGYGDDYAEAEAIMAPYGVALE